MYENEAKQQKEKVINGNVYYTYWEEMKFASCGKM